MVDKAFKSLDEYEGYIRSKISSWSPARRTLLTAAIAERWLPAYEAFSAQENWGDPAVLRRSLEAVWDTLDVRASIVKDWQSLSRQIDQITPHMDDFDANEALCACVLVQYAIDCCKSEDNLSPAWMSLATGLEAVEENLLLDDRAMSRTWKRATIQKEINKHLRLIEQIEALLNLEDSHRSLESFLKDPGIIGTFRSERKPTEPIGLTNKQAFTFYHRMVQADIKNATSRLDPRKNPDYANMLYISAWTGRYHRRKETISGGYGALLDRTASALLVSRNQANDFAEKDTPTWEPSVRQMIDRYYRNSLNGLDVRSPEEPHGYGSSLRRLWLEAKRAGLSDPEAWESIYTWAYRSPGAGGQKNKRKMAGSKMIAAEYRGQLARQLSWNTTGNLDIPWETDVDGEKWQVRLNDFPDEMMYSLVINGKIIGSFHDWPKAWKRLNKETNYKCRLSNTQP